MIKHWDEVLNELCNLDRYSLQLEYCFENWIIIYGSTLLKLCIETTDKKCLNAKKVITLCDAAAKNCDNSCNHNSSDSLSQNLCFLDVSQLCQGRNNASNTAAIAMPAKHI